MAASATAVRSLPTSNGWKPRAIPSMPMPTNGYGACAMSYTPTGCRSCGDITNATAILLSGYADDLEPQARGLYNYVAVYRDCKLEPCESASMAEIRTDERYYNPRDYGCLSFQLMGSLTCRQLIAAYGKMQSRTSLYAFLRRKARTDRDYVYELIGTLALREENYARAIEYLSKVNNRYLRTTNIYKQGMLKNRPFQAFGASWTSVLSSSLRWRSLQLRRKSARPHFVLRDGCRHCSGRCATAAVPMTADWRDWHISHFPPVNGIGAPRHVLNPKITKNACWWNMLDGSYCFLSVYPGTLYR